MQDRAHLKQPAEYFSLMVEAAPNALIMVDSQGCIVLTNHQTHNLFGYSKEEIIGKSIEMLVPERYRRSHTGLRGSFLKDPQARPMGAGRDLYGLCKDGTEVPIEIGLNPIRMAEGVFVLASVVDITERKRVQEALQSLNRELEKRVEERTAELKKVNLELLLELNERRKLEEQLRQVQKMEALGSLAGGIAHDFNNILAIIMGYGGEFLEAEVDRAQMLTAAEAIMGAGQRGARLVQQLLSFARKTSLIMSSMDMNHLIVELIKLLEHTFPKELVLKAELEPNLPSLHADSNQLQQVLLNLCMNARDAMPEGGELTIKTSLVNGQDVQRLFPGADERLYVRTVVSDTGFGMMEEIKNRVFEPFFTTKEKKGGTGLGLAVVYGIVQSHGGFIDAQSTMRKGSAFSIYIPVRAGDVDLREGFRRTETAAPGGDETILVVEDERPLLDLLASSLAKKGYRVLTARDGEEALEVYQSNLDEIDLVLLDLGLPKLNGLQVRRSLLELKSFPRMIVATGFLEPDVANEIARDGLGEIIIQKPYLPHEVLEKVRQVLDRPHPLQPSEFC